MFQSTVLPCRLHGNDVLHVHYPCFTPTTPAEAHANALITRLVTYATTVLAKEAEAEFVTAVKEGKLSSYRRPTYTVTLEKKVGPCGVTLTLTATWQKESDEKKTSALTTYWNREETLQRKRHPFPTPIRFLSTWRKKERRKGSIEFHGKV